MKRTQILAVALLITTGMLLVGCGGGDEEATQPQGDQADSVVKTMDEYREQAREEITAENAEAELERELEALEEETATP
ncbi:MAG: hypothetical protein ACYTFO_00230 [Planctomycetota bacterium]|jgi:hypothetical protein